MISPLPEKEQKISQKKKKPILNSSLMSGEGISDIEIKKQKLSKKKAEQVEIAPKEREEIKKQIATGLTIEMKTKDILSFFFLQFLPLLLFASAFFVPGIVFYFKTSLDFRNLTIIAQVTGSFFYLYDFVRLLAALTFKIEITTDKIRWRNVFWWREIPFQEGLKLSSKKGYYLYLTKIGGLLQTNIEVFQLKSENKDYWIRAYPLRKKVAKELFKKLFVWTNPTSLEADNDEQ